MAKRQIVAKIGVSGFLAEESFTSKDDAAIWKEMVETTLQHRERVGFNLSTYAAGLAATVRAHGGEYTRNAWLNIEVPQEQWAKGLPVKLDYEAMFRVVLAGRTLKPTAEYQTKG